MSEKLTFHFKFDVFLFTDDDSDEDTEDNDDSDDDDDDQNVPESPNQIKNKDTDADKGKDVTDKEVTVGGQSGKKQTKKQGGKQIFTFYNSKNITKRYLDVLNDCRVTSNLNYVNYVII